MTVFDRLGPLLILVLGALAVLVPLALFLVANKLGQIVRALWAIRSELDAPRIARVREAQSGLDALGAEKPAAPRRVSNSVFGR